MSILLPTSWPEVFHIGFWAFAIVDVARFVEVMLEFRRLGNPDWHRFHHAYIGLALLCVPTLPGRWLVLSFACWLLGIDLIHDDADEHWEQLITPGYESPWHRRYARALLWLARFTWGRWIIAQLKRVSLA